MSANVESVIAKIQKLFAMANRQMQTGDSSYETEAASAMAAVQRLCAQYNLDLATVKDTYVQGGKAAEAEAKREQTKINRSAMYKWQKRLWGVLAEANFCFHWVEEIREEAGRYHSNPARCERSWMAGEIKYRKVKRHVILGSQVNVIIVKMMGEYLADTIERMLPYPSVQRLSRSAISWRTGCADRLIARIREESRQLRKVGMDNEQQQTTALALRSLDEVEHQKNYDSLYGEGAWAKTLVKQSEYETRLAQREAERLERLKNETPEEKQLRLEQEAELERDAERRQARWEREWARERANVDMNAYRSGYSKANEINLSSQLPGNQQGQLK